MFNPSTGLFKYEYSLYSKPTSIQDIWTFDIEIRISCESVTAPGGWSGGVMEHLPPPGPIVEWGSDYETFRIRPGNSISGFSLQSKGVPGITTSHTLGWVATPSYEAGMAPEDNRPKWPEDSVKTRTIGPVPPPSYPFDPLAFADYINRMKDESSTLGWIDNEKIAASLGKKLFNARKSIGKKDKRAAKNELRAFIDLLEAQKGNHVNDSAFYLLKPNAEYLITTL